MLVCHICIQRTFFILLYDTDIVFVLWGQIHIKQNSLKLSCVNIRDYTGLCCFCCHLVAICGTYSFIQAERNSLVNKKRTFSNEFFNDTITMAIHRNQTLDPRMMNLLNKRKVVLNIFFYIGPAPYKMS